MGNRTWVIGCLAIKRRGVEQSSSSSGSYPEGRRCESYLRYLAADPEWGLGIISLWSRVRLSAAAWDRMFVGITSFCQRTNLSAFLVGPYWPYRLVVRTPASHAGNASANLARVMFRRMTGWTTSPIRWSWVRIPPSVPDGRSSAVEQRTPQGMFVSRPSGRWNLAGVAQ